MCNANGHPPGCMCGFGGEGHLGGYSGTVARTSEYSTENKCWPTTCPICGSEVFFVRHNGGSVWFDSLGHPWPKHPCFDNQKEHSQSYAKLSFGFDNLKNPLIGIVDNVEEEQSTKYLFVQTFKDLEFKLSISSKLSLHGFFGELIIFSLEDKALIRPYINNNLVKILQIEQFKSQQKTKTLPKPKPKPTPHSLIPEEKPEPTLPLQLIKREKNKGTLTLEELHLTYHILGYTYKRLQDGKIFLIPTNETYANHATALASLIPPILRNYQQMASEIKIQIEQIQQADLSLNQLFENISKDYSALQFDLSKLQENAKLQEDTRVKENARDRKLIRINSMRKKRQETGFRHEIYLKMQMYLKTHKRFLEQVNEVYSSLEFMPNLPIYTYSLSSTRQANLDFSLIAHDFRAVSNRYVLMRNTRDSKENELKIIDSKISFLESILEN